MRECEKIMFWISDKEAFVTQDEYGQDLEHVEVLQKKFDEFQKDMQNHEDRIEEINQLAEKLYNDKHPEEETIRNRQVVCTLLIQISFSIGYLTVCNVIHLQIQHFYFTHLCDLGSLASSKFFLQSHKNQEFTFCISEWVKKFWEYSVTSYWANFLEKDIFCTISTSKFVKISLFK